jgi:hypothetical protein
VVNRYDWGFYDTRGYQPDADDDDDAVADGGVYARIVWTCVETKKETTGTDAWITSEDGVGKHPLGVSNGA